MYFCSILHASLYASTAYLVILIATLFGGLGPFWPFNHVVSGHLGRTSLDVSCQVCREILMVHNLLETSPARGFIIFS